MILGITSNNHDASLALVSGNEILWAAHSERYSRKKNDNQLNEGIIQDMLQYGYPSQIVYFEKPFKKSLRKLYSGERPWRFDPFIELTKYDLDHIPVDFVNHHESHAAAGFYTSGFEDASILVVDAVGEWKTVSIWQADNTKFKCVYSKRYPDSMGLFYTAFTHYLDLKPNEEEYILMGMAAYGRPLLSDILKEEFFDSFKGPDFKLKYNLHKGCKWWELPTQFTRFDLAASVQEIMEEYLVNTTKWIKEHLPSKNLIFMGGCALNCLANSKIAQTELWDNIWIMPNPGDAGSAIGAIAAHTRTHLKWDGPFLGTDIRRNLDINAVVKELSAGNVVGVANGRAEFGPRALGNRSLFCDPRGPDAKERINNIKKREQFRPFAPAILEEFADQYFEMPIKSSPYMQFVARCKRVNDVPGVCHIDNTSRVQTVGPNDNPALRELLIKWYDVSGCPILMNTSLNVKGEPLVNTWQDAEYWQRINKIRVY